METVYGIFPTMTRATAVMHELENAGVQLDNIKLMEHYSLTPNYAARATEKPTNFYDVPPERKHSYGARDLRHDPDEAIEMLQSYGMDAAEARVFLQQLYAGAVMVVVYAQPGQVPAARALLQTPHAVGEGSSRQ